LLLGGITRLTESGVSITEWKPVSGALPPLTQAAGRPNSPNIAPRRNISDQRPGGYDAGHIQGHLLLGMGPPLAGAGHRAGLCAVGIFWVRGQMPAGYHLRLFAPLALGGLQGRGAGGWSNRASPAMCGQPSAAGHASFMALFTLAGLVWTALADLRARGQKRSRGRWAWRRWRAVLAVQLIWGRLRPGCARGMSPMNGL
jgi:cytochrome c oxidase assembly protein subunit 15